MFDELVLEGQDQDAVQSAADRLRAAILGEDDKVFSPGFRLHFLDKSFRDSNVEEVISRMQVIAEEGVTEDERARTRACTARYLQENPQRLEQFLLKICNTHVLGPGQHVTVGPLLDDGELWSFGTHIIWGTITDPPAA